MDQGEDAHIYVPFGRNYRAAMNLHVRSVNSEARAVAAMVETLRQELRTVDSRLPVLELTTLQRFHDHSLELWAIRTGGRMLVLVGTLALGLAIAGVYGVKSYLVSRRTREIGIRMALGANSGDVMGMVMRESAGLTFPGLAVGLPVALLMGKLLASILYDVSGFDLLVFVTAPALLAAASMFASYLPARRATRVNPLTHCGRINVCRMKPAREPRTPHPGPLELPKLSDLLLRALSNRCLQLLRQSSICGEDLQRLFGEPDGFGRFAGGHIGV